MKEEFISFLWKNKLLNSNYLKTYDGRQIEVLNPGLENLDAGPDFFAAKVKISDTIWVGNVEIHVKSSDWLNHNHHNNPQYDNIILHVVHDNDVDIVDTREKNIAVLEIKDKYNKTLLNNYHDLMSSRAWVPCQNQIRDVNSFITINWLNRLMVERLEGKSEEVASYLEYFKNDWEQTFFYFLARNLGFKVNSTPFGILAQRTPYLLLQKNSDDLGKLEAILFGQAGLLSDNLHDVYARLLLKEYEYQRVKYNLAPIEKSLWKFSKLRPVNFPTIRISQLAAILYGAKHLFRSIVELRQLDDIHSLLTAKSSEFWESHYTFERQSPKRIKNLGKQSIDNIIINTIAPILFVYGKHTHNDILCDKALEYLNQTPPENNTVIKKWINCGINPTNASETQALLELKKFYCTPKKCLGCAIGNQLLRP
jgi:hypothetical protein